MQNTSRVEQQLSCAACPWNKHCIEPPRMTAEEVEMKIGLDVDNEPISKEKSTGVLFSSLMSAMVYAGRDKEAPVCPVFANKLRESPELSQRIKDIMKEM